MNRNNYGSGAVPPILFIFGLVVAGGLYSICFLTILPALYGLVPDTIFKTFIIYGIFYFAPMIILIIGIIALIQAGMKQDISWSRSEFE